MEIKRLRQSLANFEVLQAGFFRRLPYNTPTQVGEYNAKKYTTKEICRSADDAILMLWEEEKKRVAMCNYNKRKR